VVEHFLRRRSQAEIAEELGVSAATVSRRSARGVERLRRILLRRGVAAVGVALGALLAPQAAQAAPATLAASLGKIALAGLGAGNAAPATSLGKELVMLIARHWVVVVGIIALGTGAVLYQGRARNAAGAQQGGQVLRVQQIVLVDAEGKERGILGVMPGGTGLVIKDAEGNDRVLVGMVEGMGSGLLVRDADGADRVIAAEMGDGSFGVGLMDQNGAPRFGVGLSADGENCGMGISDLSGAERFSLGIGATGVGLTLKDEGGVERLGMGMGPGGGGDFVAKDGMGNDVWRALGEVGPERLP
jgi:hypothetical protein